MMLQLAIGVGKSDSCGFKGGPNEEPSTPSGGSITWNERTGPLGSNLLLGE